MMKNVFSCLGIQPSEVNLLNLWLDEEDCILEQVRTCRRDLSREEVRLRRRVKKVLEWLKEKGKQEEEWREEREEQIILCKRLKQELCVQKEFKHIKVKKLFLFEMHLIFEIKCCTGVGDYINTRNTTFVSILI